MKAKERKTLVLNEDQIQIGSLLEHECDCGKTHRFLVVDRARAEEGSFSCDIFTGELSLSRCKWDLRIEIDPHGDPSLPWSDFSKAIEAGHLWIIEPDLLDEENPYVAAPKVITNVNNILRRVYARPKE